MFLRVWTKVVWRWRNGVLVEVPEEGEFYWYDGPVALAGSGTPNTRLVHYRWRTDGNGVNTAATWGAAEDTAFTAALSTNYRLRLSIENTGTAGVNIGSPRFSRCGYALAAYTTSTALGAKAVDASSDADNAATTSAQLTAGAGTRQDGVLDEGGAISLTLVNGQYTENEFAVQLVGMGGGEQGDFSHATLDTRVVTPTVNITETNGSDFAHGNQLGGNSQSVANSASISMTTAAGASAGDLVVVVVACDNNGTGDGDTTEVSSVSINGETGVKAVEYTNGQGSAQAGCSCSIWYKQLSGAMSASSTITANFTTATTSGDANCIQARAFTVSGGKTVSVDATNGVAGDAVALPSLDCTTTNTECLRVRAVSIETSPSSEQSQIGFTSASWSPWWVSGAIGRKTGSGTTGMSSYVEANISTGTSANSTITYTVTNQDSASAYVAFKATAAGATPNWFIRQRTFTGGLSKSTGGFDG